MLRRSGGRDSAARTVTMVRVCNGGGLQNRVADEVLRCGGRTVVQGAAETFETRIQARRSGAIWWLSRWVCTGTMVEGRICVSGANDLVTKADLSSDGADGVQLPPAMTLSLVWAEARGNGGLRRAIAFGGTAEGERNLGRTIKQQRSGRSPPWLQDRAARQGGVWAFN
ncbi:ATP-binding protein [Sesbania bispinosa]|nr:ATP-binding protein [Sesbania bispinosa]